MTGCGRDVGLGLGLGFRLVHPLRSLCSASPSLREGEGPPPSPLLKEGEWLVSGGGAIWWSCGMVAGRFFTALRSVQNDKVWEGSSVQNDRMAEGSRVWGGVGVPARASPSFRRGIGCRDLDAF